MKNVRCTHGSRSGLTLLELMMAITLLSILMIKAYDAVSVANDVAGDVSNEVVVEDQARRVLRQIAYAVMGANRESLAPDADAPFSTEDLRYQVNLGIQDGEVVWSDPEQIAMNEIDLEVFWKQNPATENERRVVWSQLVSPYLQGEIPNGMDDNGNGLIDEQGLSFTIDRNSVTIRLTLERRTPDGEMTTKTVQTTVTCRNLGDSE